VPSSLPIIEFFEEVSGSHNHPVGVADA